MRFAELQLLKYGHFDGCVLQFPKRQSSDFQIIYGPNEAGKSTALSAASDFLFGFPHATKYDFQFDKQLLRVGAVIETDGNRISLRRRKGNTGTLLSGDDQPVSDAILTHVLQGQTAEAFHRMFGLDHTRLRDGGRAILDAKDDVGQAIFAAGSGLVGVTRLLEDLDAQAKEIWAPRATATRSYYVASKRFDESRTALKATLLKPARWDELRKLIDDTDKTIGALRVQRTDMETARHRLERRRRIMPSVAKRGLLERSLEQLAAIPHFPADASVRFADIEKTIEGATVDKRAAADRATKATHTLSALVVDDRLLSRLSQIESLKEQRPVIADYLQDLPKRTAERDGLATRISEILNELGWQPDTYKVLHEKMPSIVRIAEVRGLLEQIGAAEAVLLKSSEDIDERQREIDDLERDKKTLQPAADTSALAAAVRFALSKGNVDRNVEAQLALLDRATTEGQRALLRLSPWSGTVDALRTQIFPTAARAGELANRMAQAAMDLRREKDALEADMSKRKQLALEQNQSVRDDRAVPPETLLQARRDRDEGWAPLRAHALGRQSLEHPIEQTQAFEALLTRADELADQRFAVAQQSGRLVALAEEIERLDLAIEEGEKKVAAAQSLIDTLDGEWSGEVSVLGSPISPGDFIAWIERHGLALSADDNAGEVGASLIQVKGEREGVRQALLGAFESGAWPANREAATGVLIELADDRIKGEDELRRTEETHQRNSEAANANHSRAKAKHKAAQDELKALTDKWTSALRSLRFEDSASTAVIRARLALLDELRRSVGDVLGLEHRIQTMQANADSFAQRVNTLANDCGYGARSKPPIELLADLAISVSSASANDQRREALKLQLAEETEKVEEADRALAQAQQRLLPFLEVGSVQDKEALRNLLNEADTRAGQRESLSALEIEIVSLGDGLTLDVLLSEVRDADPDTLKAESDAAEAQLVDLNEKIEGLMATLAAARKDFEGLNTGPDGAIAASEMAFAKAEMEAQAELYVRLRTETALLKWAIERYRSEKQAPLLSRASKLFSTLTLGRYSNLMVDNEASRPRLCGLRTGATRVTPVDGMSEGTVDQLYLALRLAAVEDSVASGIVLPFLADDLFINYDDERAAAGFRVLAELSKKTQVLFFTHHKHLAALAKSAMPSIEASICSFGT